MTSLKAQGPLLLILGIRPDIIRASIIIRLLRERLGDNFLFAWSGQHYSDNLKDVFFRELDVTAPDYDLHVSGSTDAEIAASMILATEELVDELNPAAVVFLGDTNTVMGSIAVATKNVPIVHIEGCMRSYDWRMPEEKYRTVIDHLADVIYAYLPAYKVQGEFEGLDPDRIIVTGNPIVDVLEEYFLSGRIRLSLGEKEDLLERYSVHANGYFVMTCHRRENVENTRALQQILDFAGAAEHPVIFAAGYRTQREMKEREIRVAKNVHVVDPIGYQELLELMSSARGVITDSGTVVEETSVIGVPSIQVRTATERPQVYDCGSSIKFDPHAEHPYESFSAYFSAADRRRRSGWSHPFGDGKASHRIVDDLVARYDAGVFARGVPGESRRPIASNFGLGQTGLGDYRN